MENAARLAKLAALGALLVLGACAPAPLYMTKRPVPGAVTYGEVPRDAWGEPVWSAIPLRTSGSNPASAAPAS